MGILARLEARKSGPTKFRSGRSGGFDTIVRVRTALMFAALVFVASPARGDTVTVPGIAVEGGRTTVSCGSVNRGALFGGVALPEHGAHHLVPEPWASRDHHYGTAELVGLIQRAAAAVDATHPGGVLGVADLSDEHGGDIAGHRSHQSARAADLLYYARTKSGAPFTPDGYMPVYTGSGKAYYAYAPAWTVGIPERFFDTPRNWAFVKALLTDKHVAVERIFVGARIEYWLLRHAIKTREPEALLRRARAVMQQPPGVGKHNDHMHVRVACSADDVILGRCSPPVRGRARLRAWTAACPARP
jgi:penicillin-insensitive murein endopeptidase